MGLSDAELYDRYNELYDKAESKLLRRGDDMYVDRMSKAEFNSILIAARNDNKKTGVNFVQDLVADSEYKISRKSAQASAKAYRRKAAEDPEFAEEYGATIQPWEFRRGLDTSEKAEAFFEVVSDEYWALRNSGLSGKEARKRISSTMFGSPA
jgi:hypothetical protein